MLSRFLAVRVFTLIIGCLLPVGVFGQESESEAPAFPEADIFLFSIQTSDGKVRLGESTNVTNREGYDNQPFFTPDSKSFLFSQSSNGQTDVFECFVASKECKRITQSANMEFSPTPSPDNKTISFVTDGEGANQSIWHIERSKEEDPVWTLRKQPEREPVGYYSWNHESGYILFWSRYGFSMRLVHESKTLSHYITGHAVPTTPWIIPGTSKFSYVHRQANGEVWIKELDPETRAIRPLVSMAGSNFHYNWSPDGYIWNIEGSKLKRWKEATTDGWEELADLDSHGIQNATRVSISPDGKWLAVVGVPK